MTLADMMSNFPDELTCDMAETYGIFDIKRVPASLAATLAVGLRDDSRVKMAKSGILVDNKTLLLSVIVDLLRGVPTGSLESMTACCYKSGFAVPSRPASRNNEHEIFDGPEDFRARWKEVTRS